MKGIKTIGVGIIGAGLIGGKRAVALTIVPGACLRVVFDPDVARATALANRYGADVASSMRELVDRKDIDVVIIAVPNKFTAPSAIAALRAGKHVLVEKPFGRSSKEAEKVLLVAKQYRRLVKVGFNHRFHAGIAEAHRRFVKGEIGDVMFIRARYGHGGRVGMEKEWRFKKEISGGGELLDQGVHIIDLARWFGGEPKRVYGRTETKFWKTNLEDNAFVLLEQGKATTMFHVSITQWKNLFSFEVFGKKGFLSVEGKGGSYGVETLTIGKRPREGGVPLIETMTFDRDVSWEMEWSNFLRAIRGKGEIIGDGADGRRANFLVEAIHRSSKLGKAINV
jgi:predicted dehydrogenase